jgi:hypothetical protein
LIGYLIGNFASFSGLEHVQAGFSVSFMVFPEDFPGFRVQSKDYGLEAR